MNFMLPTTSNPFFTAGLMVDTVSQHIEAQINQQNTPKPSSFSFNGAEYQAPNPNPTLIPYPRIG